jgi:hypothetical protein
MRRGEFLLESDCCPRRSPLTRHHDKRVRKPHRPVDGFSRNVIQSIA